MLLKVSDVKVRDAAKTCPEADKVLKTLFPEAFGGKPVCLLERGKFIHTVDSPILQTKDGKLLTNAIQIADGILRESSWFRNGHALYLSKSYDWHLEKNESNANMILYATQKKL